MRTVSVSTGKPYDIVLEPGGLERLGALILERAGKYTRAVIITDDIVGGLYGDPAAMSLEYAGIEVSTFSFPHGEGSKNMATVMEIMAFMAENYISRRDLVVALGGGVVGDVAGFCAAIYQRGMDFVQVPTTLLAMVDSSVGGKTGVNTDFGKNLAGAFWQPRLVLCDTDCLDTLSPEIFADGVAEVAKYGCIWDDQLFALLENGWPNAQTADIIERCVAIKAEVVAKDERESAMRRILNFGHTLGHAIEKRSNYAISHGHAVAIGMCMVTQAAQSHGLSAAGTYERLCAALKSLALPTDCDYDAKELCKLCLSDKKRSGDTISFVLLDKIGSCFVHDVKIDALEDFVCGGSL